MLITGLIGAGLLYLALATSDGRLFSAVLGVFMVSVSVMVLLGQRRSSAQRRTIDLEGRLAWAISLGGGAMAAAAAVVVSVLGVGLALVVLLGPNTGARVASGLVGAFVLAVAISMWSVVLRRPDLRISADLVQLRGPGIDSRLTWDDVEIVTHEHLGTRWGALVPRATPGVVVRLPTQAHAAADGHGRILAALLLAGRDGREAMIARGLPETSGH